MKNIDHTEEAQSICTSCGLCCDGTIFKRTTLNPEDSVKKNHDAGIFIIQCGEKSFLQQPCHYLDNRHCRIYKVRPKVCSNYKCKLLERHFAGQLSFKEGIEIVNNALKHLYELKQMLHASDTEMVNLSDLFVVWNEEQKIPDHSILLSYVAFQIRLDRYFRKDKSTSSNDTEQI